MSKEMETTTRPPSPPPSELIPLEEEEEFLEEMETFPSNSSFCCSFFPCFGSRPSLARCRSSASVWERLQQTAEAESPWWAGPLLGLKKAREWSEIIAGPKWKTFIRRFNRTMVRVRNNPGSGSGKFRYDPLSYSLNFDEGRGQDGHLGEDGGYFPDFSSRFASVPSSCKSSMDFGKNGITVPFASSKSFKDLDTKGISTPV